MKLEELIEIWNTRLSDRTLDSSKDHAVLHVIGKTDNVLMFYEIKEDHLRWFSRSESPVEYDKALRRVETIPNKGNFLKELKKQINFFKIGDLPFDLTKHQKKRLTED